MLSDDYFNGKRKIAYMKLLEQFRSTPLEESFVDVEKGPVVVVLHGDAEVEPDIRINRSSCIITDNRDVVPMTVEHEVVSTGLRVELDFTSSPQDRTVVTVCNDATVLRSLVRPGSEYLLSRMDSPVLLSVKNGMWSKELSVSQVGIVVSNRRRILGKSRFGIGFVEVTGSKRHSVMNEYFDFIKRECDIGERKIANDYNYKYDNLIIDKDENYYVIPWYSEAIRVKFFKRNSSLYVISGGYNVYMYCNYMRRDGDFVVDAYLHKGVYTLVDRCLRGVRRYQHRYDKLVEAKLELEEVKVECCAVMYHEVDLALPKYQYEPGGIIFRNDLYGRSKGTVFGIKTDPILYVENGKVYFRRDGKKFFEGVTTEWCPSGYYRLSLGVDGRWCPCRKIMGVRYNITRRLDIELAKDPVVRIGDIMNKYEFSNYGKLTIDHTIYDMCLVCYRNGCRVCGLLETG